MNHDFKKGDKVLYIPSHAFGEATHPDVERGVVSSIQDRRVFVKYDCLLGEALTGDEPWTAKATSPNDLVKV